MAFKNLLAVLVLCCASFTAISQLQIVQQSNAQILAQKLVGDGVTISNISVSGSPLSMGFFYNVGGTQLGIDSGIVLSTGRVKTQGDIGLNGSASNLASYSTSGGGDDMLSQLVAPKPTNDAVVLEFDFIPVGDTVKFRYVFSSDEYPTFNCTDFNDVFAFFISGPGIVGTNNIALVPGTDIPVAINSINNGIPGGGGTIEDCNAMGAGSPFVEYFVNNSGNPHFTHNGHTKVLTAQSAVQPCQVYHLKIAIADVQDFSYDSGVFLEAESLRSDPIQIISSLPVVNGLPYMVEGCQSGGIKIVRSRKSPNPQPVNLAFGGTAINGTDVQNIAAVATIPAGDSVVYVPITPIVDNNAEGIEVLKIYISNGCILTNFYLDSIEIQLRDYDTLSLTPVSPVGICGDATIQLNAAGNYTSFKWDPSPDLSDVNIPNPVASPNGSATYICTASLGDCHAKDSVVVTMKKLNLLTTKDIFCANGTTGEIAVTGGPEWGADVQYSINNGTYGQSSTFTNLAAGTYVVKIKDGTGCVDSLTVTLNQSFPDLTLDDSVVTASCVGSNGQIFLTANGGNPGYTYSLNNGAFTATDNFTVASGSHNLQVKDQNGCVATSTVSVAIDQPITFTTSVSPEACTGSTQGTVYMQASGGSGQYQYSVDGTNFQEADSFVVTVGNFTITVKDDKGCTASSPMVIPLGQAVFVDLGNDTTICEGGSIQFNTTFFASSFSWTADPSLSGLNISSPVATPTTTTTYYIKAVQDICTAYDTITVAVLPAPIPNAGVDSSICVGRTINLTGSGGASYQWSPASLVTDPNLQNPSIKPSQTTDYYLQVFSAAGCPSLKYDTVRVVTVPAVQAFAGRDTSVAIGQPLQLTGKDLGNSGVTIYQWSPPFGLNDPNIFNPVATLDRNQIYKLTLITPEGCEGTDYVSVKVFTTPEIYVPTGFTPNGDGNNDLLLAVPVGMKELKYFRVFNRWGQLVFSTDTESRGWDGRISGIKQSTGTFVWIAEAIDFNGNVVTRKGVTTLIR